MLRALNSDVYQLFLNKAGGKGSIHLSNTLPQICWRLQILLIESENIH